MRTRLATVLLVAVASAAAILANLALLDFASSGNDPVGKLRPQAQIPAAPASVIRPQVGRITDEGEDD